MVLIFADQADGQIKKASFEAICYGSKIAEQLGTTAEAIVLGTIAETELSALGKYGAKKVHLVTDSNLDHFDAQAYTKVIAGIVSATGTKVIIFSNGITGKAVAPRLSARLKAGLVAGKPWTATLPNGAQLLQFKQYRRMEGVLDLPAQAVVKTVTAKVVEGTTTRSAQTFKL